MRSAFLRKRLTQADFQLALYAAGSAIRDPYILISLKEASAYIRHIENGCSDHTWEALDGKIKSNLGIPDEDVARFVNDSAFQHREFQTFMLGQGDLPDYENMDEFLAAYFRRLLDEFGGSRPDQNSQDAAVEVSLLRPYPDCAPAVEQQCHIGHLVHGFVKLARWFCSTRPWSKCIRIVDASSGHKPFVQGQPCSQSIILGILCSESHWALAASFPKHAMTILFDGKDNPIIATRAQKWTESLESVLGSSTRFKLHKAVVPWQDDTWSCGHRALLAANFVLHWYFELSCPGDFPLDLPEDTFSTVKIQQVCDRLGEIGESIVNDKLAPASVKKQPVDSVDPAIKRAKTESGADSVGPASKRSKTEPVAIQEALQKLKLEVQIEQSKPNENVPAEPLVETPTRRRKMPGIDDAMSVEEAVEPVSKKPRGRKGQTQEKDQANCDTQKPQKRLTKKEVQAKVNKAQEELSQKGCSHNDEFQRFHAKMHVLPPRGHWQEFLKHVAGVIETPNQCVACLKLIDIYVHGNPPEEDQHETPDKHAEDQPRKRGRPKKADPEFVLADWIAENRAKIYTPTKEDLVFFCVACQKDVPMFRQATTYVHLHEETSNLHKRGLQTLGLSVSGEEVANRSPCHGVDTASGVSDAVLSRLQQSLRLWFNAGQPFSCGEEKKSALEQISFRMMDDRVYARHSSCVGQDCLTACQACLSILDDKKIAYEIANWGYKIDQATLAHQTAYGSEDECQRQRHTMQGRDYVTEGLAGKDMQKLFALQPRNLITVIYRSLESTPKQWRNSAYEAFLALRVHGICDFRLGNLQKDMFADMVKRYHSAMIDGTVVEDAPWIIFQKYRKMTERDGRGWKGNMLQCHGILRFNDAQCIGFCRDVYC